MHNKDMLQLLLKLSLINKALGETLEYLLIQLCIMIINREFENFRKGFIFAWKSLQNGKILVS